MPKQVHSWTFVQFAFNSYVQCECGFRPASQREMTNHMKRYSFPINPYDIMSWFGRVLSVIFSPVGRFIDSTSIVAGWFKLLILVLVGLLLLFLLVMIPVMIYGEAHYGDDAKVFFTWPGIFRFEPAQ